MPVAELTNVTKRFGPVTALDNVSLSLQPGQLTALLGPNGAGKTTAARLLLGLLNPDSGTVRCHENIPGSTAARKKTGVMLQVGRVPDTLRVREHIELFSSYYPAPLPIAETIAIAGLAGIENRLFGNLSGGQKQRLLFALAICGNPSLVILDEPTVGMDVDSRRSLWRHIRQIVERGASVLLTTHYLEEADALADRILVIDKGRITADGAPAEIKAKASARLIRCGTSLDVSTIAALTGVDRVRSDGARVEIATSNPEVVLPRLFALDPNLTGIEVTSSTLEEAFLNLTSQETAR